MQANNKKMKSRGCRKRVSITSLIFGLPFRILLILIQLYDKGMKFVKTARESSKFTEIDESCMTDESVSDSCVKRLSGDTNFHSVLMVCSIIELLIISVLHLAYVLLLQKLIN